MTKPIVWTIAGSDSSGGAGIQADLHTFNALGVHGCSVIAALTAQNTQQLSRIEFCSPEMLLAQLEALNTDLTPQAIKLGMIASLSTLQVILPFLQANPKAIVYDPVLFASVGGALHNKGVRDFLVHHFLPHITVLTPNIPEAEWLLQRTITTFAAMEQAAKDLIDLGPKVVLIKGGHCTQPDNQCQDFWTNGAHKGWLSSPRQTTANRHGTGCTLASALTAYLAQGHALSEALVLAKAYINQAIRLAIPLGSGRGTIVHKPWAEQQQDFPFVSTKAINLNTVKPFPSCGPRPLGLYPIVPNTQWVEQLLHYGVNTLQLRVKDRSEQQLRNEIKDSIALAKHYKARLFINDHWQYAIEYGAYGVHLGQEDLECADWQALQNAGLRLGISTHSYYELAKAIALKPSYIACGPIYSTQSKQLAYATQGIARLKSYCQLTTCPVVAIGGITLDNAAAVIETGADGVALISAITQTPNLKLAIEHWLSLFNEETKF